ncbi:MAG: FG-GAP-like repeat-containing protein [Candidatus Krumholzibacteriota bacterium]
MVTSFGADKQATTHEQIGGDDVLMYAIPFADIPEYPSTAFDSNGYGYIAQGVPNAVSNDQIDIHRSTDGGLTWPLWGSIADPSPSVRYGNAEILIAEGSQDRCFVACRKTPAVGNEYIVVVHAELSAAVPVFTEVAAIESTGEHVWTPHMATDAPNFSSYYLYLTARSRGIDHDKIWFARSTNQGDSWETEYTIAELAVADRDYWNPRVAYGFNSKVHVVWSFISTNGAFDSAFRYRRADSFASGGSGSWGTVLALSSTSDGFENRAPLIAASQTGDEVMITDDFDPPGTSSHIEIRASADQGTTWPTSFDLGYGDVRGLVWQSSTDTWIMNNFGHGTEIIRAAASAPTVWSDPQVFTDGAHEGIVSVNCYPAALNLAQGERIGAFWSYHYEVSGREMLFDAEWFNDPGWPVEEPDSPIELLHPPKTAPAVVDLDGDGDLEIIFSNDSDQVVALHHDGTPVAGWPVVPGVTLSGSPVAVGDLNGDESPEIAVGAVNGQIFLYDPSGTLIPGWPISAIDSAEAHVSIGTLGPPYHRVVAVCAGSHAEAFNYSGRVPPGFFFPATVEPLLHPAAIGDVNGDGLNELVIAGTHWVASYHPSGLVSFAETMPTTISDVPTLGDLDSDGDVEVLVPTVNGYMHALDDDGTELPGWPYYTGDTYPLSSAALANCLGTGEPEIAFAAQNYEVHLAYYHGGSAVGYPVSTGVGWWIYADPIMGEIEGASGDVIIGARDKKIRAWDNFGNLLGGWPRATPSYVHQTAAMGDLDLDGSTELVVLDESQLMIFDLNNAPGSSWATWAMQGHDPQRTGCWECPEDIVSGVDDPSSSGITRVRFALATGNPASSQAQFSFSLPERAVASLEVFDIRGRRIRTVMRTEAPEGTHVAVWDGRDGEGRTVASGQYLVRLSVKGPRTDEHMVRKVTWVR